METVEVSSQHQIVIPRKICESLGIRAGDKFRVFRYEHRIELIPVKCVESPRGFLKGLDTTVVRDPDRV